MSLKSPIAVPARLLHYQAALSWQFCRHAADSVARLDHGRSIVFERWCNAGLGDLRQ